MDTDVLLVSLGSTHGWRVNDDALAASLRRAGAAVDMVVAERPREVRTFALTDLAWAVAARRAAQRALDGLEPRALLYSTSTAALLAPRPGAIRFDALAAGNRPGRHGVWQRPLERQTDRGGAAARADERGGARRGAAPARPGGRRAGPDRAVRGGG